jgi:cytochrome oxidase assembly protein ShyY1
VPRDPQTSPSRLPPAAVRLMVATLIVFALVALYANWQRHRRNEHEKVSITFTSPAPSPAR